MEVTIGLLDDRHGAGSAARSARMLLKRMSKRLTANLKSRSIEEVLQVITTTLSIEYELTGDRVLFKES